MRGVDFQYEAVVLCGVEVLREVECTPGALMSNRKRPMGVLRLLNGYRSVRKMYYRRVRSL